ncbi:TonB family protein [Fulvivirgaceae bacterium BMA12]|uniref:TonB family protein n=1 Tax=Agaribacillus aureus TaxID=3051825 RepID=A0ABT8L6K3_9BACT|nr:TonB family protein [Fulvivirgaceae bacterium BMA12]
MKDPSLNSDSQKFNKLTADILKKYHEGRLTDQEMHQVEKLLLDDPFAAEALEGIETMQDPGHLEAITLDLNRQIDDRTAKKKTKTIPIYQRPWNVAAAVVMLLTASYLLFDNINWLNPSSKSQGPIALEKSSTPEKNDTQKDFEKPDESLFSAIEDTILEQGEGATAPQSESRTQQKPVVQPLENSQVAKTKTTAEKENKLVAVNDKQRARDDADVQLFADEIEADDTSESIEFEPPAQVTDTEEDFAEAPVAARRSETLSGAVPKKMSQAKKKEVLGKTNKTTNAGRSIYGQVVSAEDGRGLPGVALSVKGTTKGVYTDINGNYTLPVNESDSILRYSFIGYETEEVVLAEQERIDVELESDEMALSEVVVVAYQDDEENENFVPVISAQPKGGNPGYRRYLKDNLQYPADALDNKIEGKVKVTFFVQSDGRLSDFEIKRSLGYGCDEEVIRLIKQGPNWQPAQKGDSLIKQKVRVRVKFKLEK